MGAIFGGRPKPPAPPPPQPMPDLLDPAILAARAKQERRALAASGRQSTVLSDTNSDYSSDKLGSR